MSISRVSRGGHEKQEKSIRSLPQIASGPIPGFADPRQETELPEVWEGVHACNEVSHGQVITFAGTLDAGL